MFAKCILPAVKNRHDITHAKVVKDRLARWRKGEYKELWQEALNLTNKKDTPKRPGNPRVDELSLDEKNAQRALRLAQQG